MINNLFSVLLFLILNKKLYNTTVLGCFVFWVKWKPVTQANSNTNVSSNTEYGRVEVIILVPFIARLRLQTFDFIHTKFYFKDKFSLQTNQVRNGE